MLKDLAQWNLEKETEKKIEAFSVKYYKRCSKYNWKTFETLHFFASETAKIALINTVIYMHEDILLFASKCEIVS